MLSFRITAIFDGATAVDLSTGILDPATEIYELTPANAGLIPPWTYANLSSHDVWIQVAAITGIPLNGTGEIDIEMPNGQRLPIPGFLDAAAGTFTITNALIPQGSQIRVTALDGIGAPVAAVFQMWVYGVNDRNYAPLTCCHKFAPRGGANPLAATAECCFVFRPDEPNPAGNVFSDFSAMVAVLGTVAGRKTVVIDDSLLSPATVPAGIYDMNGSVVLGSNLQAAAELQFANGAVVSGVESYEGNLRVTSLSAAPAIVVPAGELLAVRDRAVIFQQDTGASVPIIELNAGSRLIVDTGGQLQANEDDYLVTVGAGETGRLDIGSSAVVTNYVLSGAGDYNIVIAADASYGRTHPGHAGARALSFQDPEQQQYTTQAVGTLPFIGAVLATGNLAIPLAIESDGPILVIASGANRTMTPSGADTVNGGASIVVRRNTCAILKSDNVSAWQNMCSAVGFETKSGRTPLIASWATGTDRFLAVSGAGLTGTIDVGGTVGGAADFLVSGVGRISRIVLQSNVAITGGDEMEVFRHVNGGARTVIVGNVTFAAPGVAVFTPSVETPLAPADVLQVGIALSAAGPVANAIIDMTVELEWD